jgi:hypothetical protein
MINEQWAMINGQRRRNVYSAIWRPPISLAPPRFLRKEPMAEKNPEEKGKHMGFRLEEFGSSS